MRSRPLMLSGTTAVSAPSATGSVKNGTSKSGVVRRMTQKMARRSAIRITMARTNPMFRVLRRRFAGSRSVRMARKMMLSMPRTISRIVRVTRAINESKLKSAAPSILGSPFVGSLKGGTLLTLVAGRPRECQHGNGGSQVGLGSVPKFADRRMPCERRMHDRPLNAPAAPVNETDLLEARCRCRSHVFFNNRLDVARGEAV